MTELTTFKKRLDGSFAPSNPAAQEFADKTKAGQEVAMKCSRPRSIPFHNRIFAILHAFYGSTAASEAFPSFDAFREYLTIKSGFYDTIQWPDGTLHLKAKSWEFGKMTAEEFEALRNAIATVIIRDVLKDTDPEWIWEEVGRF